MERVVPSTWIQCIKFFFALPALIQIMLGKGVLFMHEPAAVPGITLTTSLNFKVFKFWMVSWETIAPIQE